MSRPPTTALAAFILIVSACGGPAASTAPTPPSEPPMAAPAASRGPISLAGTTMTPCIAAGASAVCGTLSVLEDRANPAGRRIDLRVAVIPAVTAVPKADPLFPLDGGPGQAATEDLGWTASVFDGIHAERDIVLVDQRGTGGSNRMVVTDPPDTTGLGEAEATKKIEAWLSDKKP